MSNTSPCTIVIFEPDAIRGTRNLMIAAEFCLKSMIHIPGDGERIDEALSLRIMRIGGIVCGTSCAVSGIQFIRAAGAQSAPSVSYSGCEKCRPSLSISSLRASYTSPLYSESVTIGPSAAVHFPLRELLMKTALLSLTVARARSSICGGTGRLPGSVVAYGLEWFSEPVLNHPLPSSMPSELFPALRQCDRS